MSVRPIPATATQRERQSQALGELFEKSGMALTPAAAAVGVSASQFSRYLSGETILPTPYYDRVAQAFKISRADLVIRLGLLDDEDEQVREAVDTLRAMVVREAPADQEERPILGPRAQEAV